MVAGGPGDAFVHPAFPGLDLVIEDKGSLPGGDLGER